ncbi:hypothetical protein MJO28_017685 [Puccinia striiformis f. sp. tritici]|nr:hypothetical protein MJO28_017685 [Puccinia striiformis f. sp. tritici]
MAKSHKASSSEHHCRHTSSDSKAWSMILLYPIRFFGMSLVKLLTSILAHPRQTFTAIILTVLVFYFFYIIDNIVALVLPFKPFDMLYSHVKMSLRGTLVVIFSSVLNLIKGFSEPLLMAAGICGGAIEQRSSYSMPRPLKNIYHPLRLTSSVLVSLNQTEKSVLETTDLWQLSNALLFMDMKLGNHTKISSQVRNLANVYSRFTDEIEKLDLAGIHTIELISQEYFKMIYQSKHTETQVINSMSKLSNYEVANLQANVNQTIKLACNLLAEQDATSVLFHDEISSLERAQYRRGLWIFRKGGYKMAEIKETMAFLHQNKIDLKRSWFALEMQRRKLVLFLEKTQQMKLITLLLGLYVKCRWRDCRLGVDICALFRSFPEIKVIQSTTEVDGAQYGL